MGKLLDFTADVRRLVLESPCKRKVSSVVAFCTYHGIEAYTPCQSCMLAAELRVKAAVR